LAHEIKNPLTPIQLSAERLQMKLEDKLQGAEAQLLNKSVSTIVDQVDALKRLVDEFRDYARLPAAQLQPLDLNALLRELAHLYARAVVPVQWQLGADLPLIMGDAQQLRQVVHNLVQNAQDAAQARFDADRVNAAKPSEPNEAKGCRAAQVEVCTKLGRSGERVRLIVRDNGSGFPASILRRAFEPYITTKIKGTGLGLAVVKKIADEHQAPIDISNIAWPHEEGDLPVDAASTLAPAPADATWAGAQIVLSFPMAASEDAAAS